jgi:uncharacterized iron-regulated protein
MQEADFRKIGMGKSPKVLRTLFIWTLMAVTLWLTVFPGRAMAESEEMIIDMLMGEPIPLEMMLEDISTVGIIYLGEIHTIERHHKIKTRIVRRMADRGLSLALGMEQFGVEDQAVLNEWRKGDESLDALKKKLGVYWTNLDDYGPLLLTARRLGIPILGLNAPDKLVKQVARKGIEGLTKADREKIPEGTADLNPKNDRLLRMRLRVHRAFEGKSLDRIVLAQALRDETMARTATRFLESPEGKGRILLVVAGSGHVNYGFGIPERGFRLNKLPYRIILPTESGQLELTEEEQRQVAPVTITHEDLKFIRSPIADYLHVVPREKDKEQETPHASPEMTLSDSTDR